MEEELKSYLAPAQYDFLDDDEPSQPQEEEEQQQPELPLAEQEDEDERNHQQGDEEDDDDEEDGEDRGNREETQGLQQHTVAYKDIVSYFRFCFIFIICIFCGGTMMVLLQVTWFVIHEGRCLLVPRFLLLEFYCTS